MPGDSRRQSAFRLLHVPPSNLRNHFDFRRACGWMEFLGLARQLVRPFSSSSAVALIIVTRVAAAYCSRHGVPASVVNVPLLENQPFTPSDGAPINQEKNASSCK